MWLAVCFVNQCATVVKLRGQVQCVFVRLCFSEPASFFTRNWNIFKKLAHAQEKGTRTRKGHTHKKRAHAQETGTRTLVQESETQVRNSI